MILRARPRVNVRSTDFSHCPMEGFPVPHDRTGRPLAKGDRVTFEAEVVEVFAGEQACNGSFRIVAPAGDSQYTPFFSCNTGLCEQVHGTEDVDWRRMAA